MHHARFATIRPRFILALTMLAATSLANAQHVLQFGARGDLALSAGQATIMFGRGTGIMVIGCHLMTAVRLIWVLIQQQI